MRVAELNITERTPFSATAEITIRNTYSAWYEVTIFTTSRKGLGLSPQVKRFVLFPNGEVPLGTLTFGPGETLRLSADGTSNSDLVVSLLAIDLIYRLAIGSPLPNPPPEGYIDVTLDLIGQVLPFSAFLVNVGRHLIKKDFKELKDDLLSLPTNESAPLR